MIEHLQHILPEGSSEGLIKTVSSIIGAYFKPIATAKGRVRADEILRKYAVRLNGDKGVASELDEFNIESRASMRRCQDEDYEQRNLEAIAQQFVLEASGSTGEAPSEDWAYHFRNSAKGSGDEMLQTLWARVLSAEYNRPGSVSIRAVDTIKHMDRAEAEMFEKLLGVATADGAILCDKSDSQLLSVAELSFDNLLLLVEIGLVVSTSIYALEMTGERVLTRRHQEEQFIGEIALKGVDLCYSGDRFFIYCPDHSVAQLDVLLLTEVGKALARIIASKPNRGAIGNMLSMLQRKGSSIMMYQEDGTVIYESMTSAQVHEYAQSCIAVQGG